MPSFKFSPTLANGFTTFAMFSTLCVTTALPMFHMLVKSEVGSLPVIVASDTRGSRQG